MQTQKVNIITIGMKEINEEKNIETGEVTTNALQFFKKYEKVIYIAIIAVIVVILGIFGYKKFISEPRAVEATEQGFVAYDLFMNGQYQEALNGANGDMGFNAIIDEYGHTPYGNLAKYCAGICELNLGNYQAAIDRLESYKGHDAFTQYQVIMLLGDAYAELGNFQKAASYYEKATKTESEDIIAPTALYKLALTYSNLNENEKAQEVLNTLKTKYPMSVEANGPEADKMLGTMEF